MGMFVRVRIHIYIYMVYIYTHTYACIHLYIRTSAKEPPQLLEFRVKGLDLLTFHRFTLLLWVQSSYCHLPFVTEGARGPVTMSPGSFSSYSSLYSALTKPWIQEVSQAS